MTSVSVFQRILTKANGVIIGLITLLGVQDLALEKKMLDESFRII